MYVNDIANKIGKPLYAKAKEKVGSSMKLFRTRLTYTDNSHSMYQLLKFQLY